MKKIKRENSGFTFIEALVSIAIFIFILVTFITLYANYSRAFKFEQEVSRLTSSARAIANELRNKALQADQIVVSHSFSGQSYSTDADTLVLELPAVDSSGNIISDHFDYVVFYLTGNNFYELLDADGSSSRVSGLRQLSDAVSSLSFTYNNADVTQADKITADIEQDSIAGRKVVQNQSHEEIYLRNK